MATKTNTKREFDKESMYSKIMPSGARKKEIEADGINEEEIDLLAEANKTLNEAAARTVEAPKEKKVYSTAGIHIVKPEKQALLINITEYAVNRRINEAFAKFKCCKCDRCMKDVAAVTLNKLPAKYVVVDEDQIDEVVDANSADVIPALVSAIMVVKANPRH